MASNKTANYGLNQWEATDKVERLDFNADNAKIDAALHNLEQARAADMETLRGEQMWVKLGENTLSSSSSEITCNVPDMGQYQQLLIDFSVSNARVVYLTWNSTNLTQLFGLSNATILATGKVAVSAVHYSGGGFAAYECYSSQTNSGGTRTDNGCAYSADATFSGAVTVGLRATTSFAVGNHVAVYGLKN